jgi:thiamine pyrophosphate-dependent acetolactate synthase large subunit-like protein
MDPGAVVREAETLLRLSEASTGPVGSAGSQRLLRGPLLDRLSDPSSKVVVFAGPGVARSGAVAALRELAARANVGVANSWGAKGLFEWQSPHHLGTVGLQERDFELCGFPTCDVLIATGVDPEETPKERWETERVVEVDPGDLPRLRIARRSAAIARPALYQRLAEVVMPQYGSTRRPPPPGRLIADLRARLGPLDRVAAQPGTLAGFWVARAFPTTRLGSVIVPARRLPGFAAAASLAAARRGERVVGVTDGPIDDATAMVLELAAEEGVPVELEVWGEGGVEVDWSSTAALIEVAGPVVAWGGVALP